MKNNKQRPTSAGMINKKLVRKPSTKEQIKGLMISPRVVQTPDVVVVGGRTSKVEVDVEVGGEKVDVEVDVEQKIVA